MATNPNAAPPAVAPPAAPYQSDQSLDPSNWAKQGYDWAKQFGQSAWDAIKPPSTANIDQAFADSRALEGQFIQQQGQQQATPGLSYTGSAPTVAAPSSAPPPAGSWAAAGAPQAMQMQAAQQQGGAAPPAGGQSGQFLQYNGAPDPVSGPAGGAMPPPPPPMGVAQPPPAGTGATSAEARSGAGHFSPTAAPTMSPSGYIAPIARSGPGHFTEGDPSITGAAVPGSIIGPTNPVAAPPDANLMPGQGQAPPAPTAPGMMAASMQAAQLDPTQQDQFRQQQMGLAGSLQDTIAGRGTSVAQLQQQQAFAQQQAQQMGMAAAMGRGGNTALAMRTAAGNMGQLGAQQASASALQRAQETAIAQGQLGAVLGQGRGADIGIAQQNAANIQAGNSQNAAMLQQANANNQQSQLGFRGQNVQEQSNRANQTLQANKNAADAAGAQFNAKTSAAGQAGGLLSAGAGALAALSDKRAKTDIEPASSDDFKEFLGKMKPAHWRYKGDPGPRTGPMAQDVESSRVGKTMVRETPAGKAIDIPAATTSLLAALADVHRRLTAVEGRKAA